MGTSIYKKQRTVIKKCAFLTLLHLVLCLYSSEGFSGTRDRYTVILTDTVPARELKSLKWSRLVPVNGVLKIEQQNADSLIIRRKDYESYARESGLVLASTYNELFTKVEIEPEYPGGPDAWEMYVKKQSRNLQKNMKDTIKIIVQFIVNQDGTIDDVEAVSGSTVNGSGFRNEAVRLVRMSGSWNPAIQNFRIVRAYKKQAVIFIPKD